MTLRTFDFGEAILHLSVGLRVRRIGWMEWIWLQKTDTIQEKRADGVPVSDPTLVIHRGAQLSTWTPTSQDLLSSDWILESTPTHPLPAYLAQRKLTFAVDRAEKAVIDAVLTDAWSGGMKISQAKQDLLKAKEAWERGADRDHLGPPIEST